MLRCIFLLSLIFITYSCGFEQLEHPPLKYVSAEAPKREDGRILQQGYENLRIYADYSNLEAPEAEKNYIQYQLMPSAMSYFESTLKIKRTREFLVLNSSCEEAPLPDSVLNTELDADLFFIVAAQNLTDQFFIAGAFACGLSPDDDRPIMGIIIFNLAYLFTGNVTSHQNNLSAALHEIVHALAFSNLLYPYFRDPVTGERLSGILGTTTLNGNPVPILNVEPLTSRVREYFGCPTVEGAYLEDDGDVGRNIASHFERRVFGNEFMTSTASAEPVVSELTLAVLESSGWYKPNYNMAEPFEFGKNQGCEFIDGPCLNSQGIPNFPEYCDTNVDIGCTWTSRARGLCAVSLQADIFADDCPYYISPAVYDCKDAANQAFASPGETYGLSSRCYTGTLVNTSSEATHGSYCFSTQCKGSDGNYKLTLMIGNEKITCACKGPVSIAGYNGRLDCPDPNEFCARANPIFCEKGCSGRGKCVSNRCECPAGWGGTDCAERVFDENCDRCSCEPGRGCYGDQCISRDEILDQ